MEEQHHRGEISPPLLESEREETFKIQPLGPKILANGMAWTGVLIGLCVAAVFLHNAQNIDEGFWALFPFGAAFGGWISGKFFWNKLVLKNSEANLKKSLLAGFLTGAVSHLICWHIVIWGWTGICLLFPNQLNTPFSSRGYTDILYLPWMYTVSSLILVGWLTIGGGLFFAYRSHQKARYQQGSG